MTPAVRGEYPDAKTIIGLLLAEKKLQERKPQNMPYDNIILDEAGPGPNNALVPLVE